MQKKKKHNRKWWFRVLKGFMRLFVKKTEFIYLNGKGIEKGSIILSNHVGTTAPLGFELYGPKNIRHWGAYEMNSGLIELYKYQTRVYYHEKKHWNLGLARLFCLIASPLTNIFYKGLNLISTYRDHRFRNTIKQSMEAIKNEESVIIYPEDSTKGYLDELDGFHPGFVLLASMCFNKGIDVPIHVAYCDKKQHKFMIDKPIMFSSLQQQFKTKEEIAKHLCNRCNELGKMLRDNVEIQTETKDNKIDDEETEVVLEQN